MRSKAVFVTALFGLLVAASCQVPGNGTRQGKFGFLTGATSMISSLAQDLMTRGGTSSQVLSLNLTNLFILLVLKAIVFGAGAFGYGPNSYGRSVDDNLTEKFSFNEFLSESELVMMLGFLKGDSTQDYGCLQRIACQEPLRAEEYAFTGKLFLKGYEFLAQSVNSSKYENALARMEEAINYGLTGQNCLERYGCEVS